MASSTAVLCSLALLSFGALQVQAQSNFAGSCAGACQDMHVKVTDCFCDELCTLYMNCCDDACDSCSVCYDMQPPVCEDGQTHLAVYVKVSKEELSCCWNEVSWEVVQFDFDMLAYRILSEGGVNDHASLCVSHTTLKTPYYIVIRDSGGNAFEGKIYLSAGDTEIYSTGQEALADGYQATWKLVLPAGQDASFSKQLSLPCDKFDCMGSCYASYFESWAQDEICDDGQSGAAAFLVNRAGSASGLVFNCQKFNNDSGACNYRYDPVQLPKPLVVFPMNESEGNTIYSYDYNEEFFDTPISGALQNTQWVDDPLLGVALQCNKDLNSFVNIDDFDYGTGAFSVSLMFRHDSAQGFDDEFLFSHGTADPTIYAPHNLNINLAEEFNNFHGIMRFALKASEDTYEEFFVDSDGILSNNEPRDQPGHINLLDGKWHMASLVQDSTGYRVFLDGRLSGYSGDDGGMGFVTGPINPSGKISLCSRTDPNDAKSHFNGAISNLHFYSEALTDLQVYQLYQEMSICDNRNDIRPTRSGRTCCIPPAQGVLIGDTNEDDVRNVFDVVEITNYILDADFSYFKACTEYTADLNQDQDIDVEDIIILVSIILGKLPPPPPN